MKKTFQARCLENLSDMTKGKVYTVWQSDAHDCFRTIDDKGKEVGYYKRRFEVLPEASQDPNLQEIQEKMAKAQGLIGKQVYDSVLDQFLKVDGVKLVLANRDNGNCSVRCRNVANEKGYCVGLESGCFTIPFEEASTINRNVKLNKKYSANISQDGKTVEVGCQTIDAAQVLELAEAIKNVQKFAQKH